MSTTEEHDYVSAVFVHLLQPIADLCDQMLRLSSGEPNEVQTSPRENGYAISIIALSAFVLEGACGRARYVCGSGQKQCSPADTLRDFGESGLAQRIQEIFVVRDAIAHAHLWTAKISWAENNLELLGPPVQLPGYGDKKFEKLVDPDSRTTRQLKLDVFPTRIHRRTAIIVLKECAEALQFLESKDRRFVYLTPQQVRVDDKFIPFYKWVRQLPTRSGGRYCQ
jgi:hypothetical protein